MQDPVNNGGDVLPYPAQPATAGLNRYRAAIRQKWWILPITVVLAGAGAFAYTKQRELEFVSKATMWVTGRMRIGDVGQYTEDVSSFFGTQISLMQSTRMGEKALARLQTVKPDTALRTDKQGRPIYPVIRITQAPRSGVFLLSCYSTDPVLAQTYLNALMDEFLAYKKEVRANTSGNALASVSDQVFKQERELKLEQEKLSDFQRTNNLALLQEQAQGGGSQLAMLSAQLGSLQLDLKLLDAVALEQTIGKDSRTNQPTSLPDLRSLTGSSGLAGSIPQDFLASRQQVQNLKIQREQLSRYLKPKHYKIVKLDEEITRLDKVITSSQELFQQQTQEQIATAKQALKIRIENISASVKDLEARVGDATRLLAEVDRLKNAIARQQSLYDRMLSLSQSVDLNRNLDQESVSILERGSRPILSTRSSPIVLALGLGGGLFAGLGVLFLLARLDDRCGTLDELRGRFGEEVLGQLPDLRQKRGHNGLALLQSHDDRHMFAESFRNLRSSLLYRGAEPTRVKTVVVTSTLPNEGKSTTTINLARTLAFAGSRVLLVDCDLRCGNLHHLLGSPAAPGLTDLLQGDGEMDGVIRQTDLPNLFFLPCGTENTDSGELFLSKAFDEFLARAKDKFEYIFIDSIPVFAADDTSTLAPKSDAVLFVVRSESTSSRMARQALDILYDRRVNVLGLILNRVDTRASDYHYYKYSKYYTTKRIANA